MTSASGLEPKILNFTLILWSAIGITIGLLQLPSIFATICLIPLCLGLGYGIGGLVINE